MIDELADGELRGEFGDGSVVIAMPVSNDEVVDLRQSRGLDRIGDAAGIARSLIARVARIDEQRFVIGRDEECGVAAFHVDDIHVEGGLRGKPRGKAAATSATMKSNPFSVLVTLNIPIVLSVPIVASSIGTATVGVLLPDSSRFSLALLLIQSACRRVLVMRHNVYGWLYSYE